MAEKSIRIADDTSGSYVATRDAFEQDAGSHDRVIERVDFASGKFDSPRGNAIRGASAAVTTTDPLDITDLPAGLTNNLITVGDKSMVIVFPEHTASDGSVTVTPLLYDNESSPNIVGILDSKTSAVDQLFRRGSSSGNYLSEAMTWDVTGAYKIGLHITSIGGTSNGVQLWGFVI